MISAQEALERMREGNGRFVAGVRGGAALTSQARRGELVAKRFGTPLVVVLSLYFAPVANLVLSTVRRKEEGKASGVNNTAREVGGVFGVAVLASVFAAVGGYATPQLFVDGMTAALWVGTAAVALAGVAAIMIPPREDVIPDSVSLLERDAHEGAGPGRGRPATDGDLACEPEAAA